MLIQAKTRRQFIKIAGASVAASLIGKSTSIAQVRGLASQKPGSQLFHLGMASYTLRKFDLNDTLAMTKRLGLKYICFKDVHLPLDSTPAQIRDVVAKVKNAGLILYGGGVIYMRNQNQVNRAFDYARTAGMKVIVGVPVPELLPLIDKKVQQYDIKVAIHNHGPGDKVYPTPASVYERISNLDKRIGLCIDIGHTVRAGADLIASVEKFADRLLDMHIKDVSEATEEGHAVEIGRGVIDIPLFLKTLKKVGYSGIVSFEYEKDADDPMPGLAESVGYVRGVLAVI